MLKKFALITSALFIISASIMSIGATFKPIEELPIEEEAASVEDKMDKPIEIVTPRKDLDYIAIKHMKEEHMKKESIEASAPAIACDVEILNMKSSNEDGIENGVYPTNPFIEAIDTDRVVWYTGNMRQCSCETSCYEYKASKKDLDWMARIMHAEICDQGSEARRAVGTVVMNRIDSDEFPDTVLGVISQAGQFSPWDNGSIYDEPCDYCKEAAIDVLKNGYRAFPKEVLYFQSIEDGYFENQLTYAYFTEAGFDTWFSFDPEDTCTTEVA